MKDIATDWAKFGTMFVVSHWLAGGSLTDRNWQMASIFTLLGFAAYHLSTRNVLTPQWQGKSKAIADDWIKVGTMLVVSRMLSGGGLGDGDWIRASLGTLIGFTVYNIVVADYIQGKELTYNDKLQDVINDWAKVGTMLIVSRVISCQPMLDPKWMVGAFGTLLGFTAYDLGTSHLIDAAFD